MAEYFAGGHLRFVDGAWRDDDGNMIEIYTVRHGRWVPYHDSDFGWDEYGYKCSACNYRVERDEFTFVENFCPLCGAKMDLEG